MMHFYAFAIILCIVVVRSTSESSTNELPDCSQAPKPSDARKTFRELFIVSTLDGKISALDPQAHGNLVWSHETGPGGLLSSSLSKLEMRNRGQRVRLVPSLDGSLYKFDGDTVEPLPMSADFLLKSSYRLGDDLVITGGKEARTYGINIHTGQVRYICTMSGCDNTKEDFSTEDVLVVKRNTQTVRAVEPRSGREKWNFSVGENQLTVLKGLMASCTGSSSSSSESGDTDSYGVEEPSNCSSGEGCSKESLIQVVVPEGLVASTSTSKGSLEWSVKLPSPVVGAWHLRNGELEVVDLFEHSRILGLDGPNQSKQNNPVLYLGMHDRQLYVQHSGNIHSEVSGGYSQLIDPHRSNLPQVEWKPYLASAPSRTPIINTGNKAAPPMLEESSSSRKALMIKDDILDYPFDTGYYLYRGVDLDNDSVLLCEKEEVAETLNEHIVKSLRFWWKEISLIVLATFMINIFITKHVLRRFKLKHLQELSSKETKSNSGSESAVIPVSEQPVGQPSVDVGSAVGDLPKYTSRYLADFEPVRCLGKGGFGLVLESRNKLDDCTYAVKRICLPNNPDARDKVMREAKALAKLDHSGIVRYYNAWLESPPPGWQEHQDDVWQGSFDACTSFSYSDKTTTSAAKDSSWGNATRPFNPLRPFEDQFSFGDIGHSGAVLSSMNSSSSGITTDRHTSDDRSLRMPFSAYAATDEDDSLIEFERSSNNVKEKSISRSSAKPKENGERPKSLSLPEQPPVKVYLYIQMQLCKKESLKEWLHAHSTDRDYESVLDIFYQIVSAVEYVHENGLIHRDLKPSNIFFAMDDAIKVGDFGLVTALTGGSVVATPLKEPSEDLFSSKSGRLTDQVGTQLYMSPEQIDGLKYNQSVDIFSLGLIFFELLWPFSTQMERIQVLMNVKRLIFPPKFVKTYANECKLIEKLLSHDSEKRPSAKDIRQHPLFRPFQPSDEIAHLARLRRRNLSHRQSSSLSE